MIPGMEDGREVRDEPGTLTSGKSLMCRRVAAGGLCSVPLMTCKLVLEGFSQLSSWRHCHQMEALL